ncbi:hypothetical protein AAG592_12730 [Citromicrobium bathyomarinum]
MGIFSSIFGGLSRGAVIEHRRSSKIDKINAWKVAKKVRGDWIPHDEWVKGKRRR